MCGIAGIWAVAGDPSQRQEKRHIIRAMASAIAHRGPDDEGYWEEDSGLFLAHRRLSIQDLSALGHQPMQSSCQRYVVVFNGEIYNFLELRQQLSQAGFVFLGHSDTEVLLAAVVHWGVVDALQKFNGMFALALWDNHTHTLTLARDRVGKKPLYYGWAGRDLVFSSELKAITQHPGFEKKVNLEAVTSYLKHNYVPAPYSIYQGIYKLLPGSYLTLSPQDIVQHGDIASSTQYYWNPLASLQSCRNDLYDISYTGAVTQLENLLRESISKRMISDVPLGMLLSGGIDSTLVTAIAQAQSQTPLNTFSIGFDNEQISEAAAAKKIAEHLGTHHTELYLSGQDALDVIPMLPTINDEPFGDPSQIPTYLVSKLAREKVTVALTGDGGDELFCGYTRYLSGLKIWKLNQKLPAWFKKPLGQLLARADRLTATESRLAVHAECLLADHSLDVYDSRLAKFNRPAALLASPVSGDWYRRSQVRGMRLSDPQMAMMAQDFLSYLVDGVLVKVDRASMRESLELRSPLLDPNIIEFAWRLPMQYKLSAKTDHKVQGKRILRDVLNRHVPPALTDRPKQGFGSPVNSWLQGPLKSWADELLCRERLESDGVFNSKVVGQLWEQCKANPNKGHSRLWTILMFQVWYAGNM